MKMKVDVAEKLDDYSLYHIMGSTLLDEKLYDDADAVDMDHGLLQVKIL